MHDIVNGFLSGRGYGWGSTANEVHDTINGTMSRVQAGTARTGPTANTMAGTASAMTSDISRNTIFNPTNYPPLEDPDGSKTIMDSDHLRDVNRREENGEGRIRTTATGIAAEGIGNVFKGTIDSPGMSPTEKGYFDDPPRVTEGVTIPAPGPVPKGSPSTLGDKK